MTQDLDSARPEGGFADLVGYRLARWEEDEAEGRLQLAERHLNRQGLMHGGVLTTLLDTILGYSGIFTAKPGRERRALTLSLTCNFIGAGRLGETLIITARRTGGGRSVFFASGEVRNEAGRLLGTAEGVFKYRGDSGLSDAELPDER
ncbi:MAG: PaaI family thioesterase [Rhodospirillales bacterium]